MKPILWRPPWDVPLLTDLLTFPAYFTLVAVGMLLGAWLALRAARGLALDRDDLIDLCIGLAIAGVIGSRVQHVLFDEHLMDYVHLCTDPTRIAAEDPPVSRCSSHQDCGTEPRCEGSALGQAARMFGLCSNGEARPRGGFFLCGPDHACHPPRDCLLAFKVWRGGLAFLGGLFFATGFAYWFVRRRGLSFWKVADLMAPIVALGLFFGRMGCWFNGCCFGQVTAGAHGVVFPFKGAAWREHFDQGLIGARELPLPVHPTQLWQAALNLATFAFLYLLVRPRKRFDGQVLAWLFIAKALTRSTVEVFRDDERGVFFGGLASTSQLLSVPMLLFGVWLLRRLGRAAAEPPAPA